MLWLWLLRCIPCYRAARLAQFREWRRWRDGLMELYTITTNAEKMLESERLKMDLAERWQWRKLKLDSYWAGVHHLRMQPSKPKRQRPRPKCMRPRRVAGVA